LGIDNLDDFCIEYFVDSDPSNSTYPKTVQFFNADNDREGEIFVGSDSFNEADYTAGSKTINLGNG